MEDQEDEFGHQPTGIVKISGNGSRDCARQQTGDPQKHDEGGRRHHQEIRQYRYQ